jgi:hypothetical protein
MTKTKSFILASVLAGSFGVAGAGSAQALSLGSATYPGVTSQFDTPLIQQVQRRRFRGGGRRGGRGIGTGAAIGLGILGLGLAGAAAANAGPRYYRDRECWIERRPMYNRYGDYIGRRNVEVCN